MSTTVSLGSGSVFPTLDQRLPPSLRLSKRSIPQSSVTISIEPLESIENSIQLKRQVV